MEKVKILFIAILFSISVLSAISYTEFVDIYYDYSGSNSMIILDQTARSVIF